MHAEATGSMSLAKCSVLHMGNPPVAGRMPYLCVACTAKGPEYSEAAVKRSANQAQDVVNLTGTSGDAKCGFPILVLVAALIMGLDPSFPFLKCCHLKVLDSP